MTEENIAGISGYWTLCGCLTGSDSWSEVKAKAMKVFEVLDPMAVLYDIDGPKACALIFYTKDLSLIEALREIDYCAVDEFLGTAIDAQNFYDYWTRLNVV